MNGWLNGVIFREDRTGVGRATDEGQNIVLGLGPDEAGLLGIGPPYVQEGLLLV